MDIPHNQCVFWGQDWKYEIPIYLMSKPFKMQSHMANGIALSIWCRLERYAKCNKSRTVDFVSICTQPNMTVWVLSEAAVKT